MSDLPGKKISTNLYTQNNLTDWLMFGMTIHSEIGKLGVI
jgi:hypothetical protein